MKTVTQVYRIMAESKQIVLVHCAAGIHRTGVFAYSLLRATGLGGKSAMAKILEIREVTHRGVGQDRIEGANLYIIPSLLKAIKESKEPDPEVLIKKFEEEKKMELEEEEAMKKERIKIVEAKRAERALKKEKEELLKEEKSPPPAEELGSLFEAD